MPALTILAVIGATALTVLTPMYISQGKPLAAALAAAGACCQGWWIIRAHRARSHTPTGRQDHTGPHSNHH